MKTRWWMVVAVLLLAAMFFTACTGGGPRESGTKPAVDGTAKEAVVSDALPKAPTELTAQVNEGVYALLDFSDERERENAERGLLSAPEALEVRDGNGKVVWSQKAYAFVEDAKAPDSANPSLWRDTQLNHIYGLFEVSDGIYQVRGYDMTNITFIEGKTGWIVFDPLMSVECAQAALTLVNETLGERPVTGVVMSHPHVDHYGGIKGVVPEGAEIPIIVPNGFEEHAVSENVYAGNAMGRRAGYQYGVLLDKGAQGSLAMGIGLGQSTGTVSYLSPNDMIKETGERRTVDGVEMEFHMTPGTEAPAEMNTWFPQKKALWLTENCTGTLHNLYTLRGAEVRDGNAWANYIMEALARYGADVQVVFQSHNWPHWENETINEYMQNTAAVYKYITTQTLMYINEGYTANEIANMIELPAALEENWYTRQYYGTVAHNAKAVYQKYMGWYDANPVNLNPLPPDESAKKFVEYLGDTDEVLRRAKQDFDKGEYQWVAQVTNILVFADPQNTQARYLCADALEQLGYQAESGTWRNAYLSGAKELREGTNANPDLKAKGSADLRGSMTPEMALDYLGIMVDAKAAEDINTVVNLAFTDGEPYVLRINAGVVLYEEGLLAADADATITLPRAATGILLSTDEAQWKEIAVEGDLSAFRQLQGHMAEFEPFFNIVEP